MALSQQELARRARLFQAYISDLEAGKRNVSIDNIGRIADALGVPAAELFDSRPPRHSSRRRA